VVGSRASSRITPSASNRRFGYHLTDDSVVVITAGGSHAPAGGNGGAVAGMASVVRNSRAEVFDLRSDDATNAYGRLQLDARFQEIERLLLPDTAGGAGRVRRVYTGYETPSPSSSGQYRTGTFVQAGTRLVPLREAHGFPPPIC
jgi:hypothetical protein